MHAMHIYMYICIIYIYVCVCEHMYYPCTAGGRAVFRLLRIDFSHFLQVMKVRGSELGDGPLAEDGKVV
jgi:hypothetical protein